MRHLDLMNAAKTKHHGIRLTYAFSPNAVEINSMDGDGTTILLARVSMWFEVDHRPLNSRAYWLSPSLTVGDEVYDEYTRTLATEALNIARTIEAIWAALQGKPMKWDALQALRDHTLALTLPERFRRALACSIPRAKRNGTAA